MNKGKKRSKINHKMMHYKKGKNVEEELQKESIPIECLPNDFLWMHVKGGTEVNKVVQYAKNAFDEGTHRSVVWSGVGGGVCKTISCAEILKRSYEFHQVTRVCYRNIQEFWDPQMEGLEQIVATRKIPSIHILLSLDAINKNTPGYQHSNSQTEFWVEKTSQRKDNNRQTNDNHRNQPSGSGSNNQGRGKGRNFGNQNSKIKSPNNRKNSKEKKPQVSMQE